MDAQAGSLYSCHTFYFPFVYSPSAGFSELTDYFRASRYWIDTGFTSAESLRSEAYYSSDPARVSDRLRWDYQSFQYFNAPARKAIFGCGAGVVSRFEFRFPAVAAGEAQYCITKGEQVYTLRLEAVSLRIYNTGIAVISFECENLCHRSIRAVKEINEYGRRMLLPFLPLETGFTLCADRLEIRIGGETFAQDDFQALCRDRQGAYRYSDFGAHICLTNVPNIIIRFLDETGDLRFVSDHARADAGQVYIHPAIDDRMFVACIVMDEEAAERYTHCDSEPAYTAGDTACHAYQKDYALACDLFELISVDCPGACTCPDPAMLRRLLDQQVYTRWASRRTVEAVTHTSAVWVCMPQLRDAVINPFLIEYCEMVSLCLAQRASIIALQERATNMSASIRDVGSRTARKAGDLIALQGEYAAFLNEVYLFEVTAQDQGIEFYNLLRDSMYIGGELKELEDQIDKMNDAANTALDHDLNHYGFWLAIFALIISLSGPLIDQWDILEKLGGQNPTAFWIGFAVILGILIGILAAMLRTSRRRSRLKKH